MDAFDFFKTMDRLCAQCNVDFECPIEQYCGVHLESIYAEHNSHELKETIDAVEKWAKEHPVNAEKYREVVKQTFGTDLNADIRAMCPPIFYGNKCPDKTPCADCRKWWDEEYEEPEEEK